MRYLIDTHVFLWFVSSAKELSKTAGTLIEDGQNEIFISVNSRHCDAVSVNLDVTFDNGSHNLFILAFSKRFLKYFESSVSSVLSPAFRRLFISYIQPFK